MGGRRALAIVLMLNLIMASLALTTPQAVGAAATTVFVTPSTFTSTGWVTQSEVCGGGLPQTPALSTL